MVLAGHFGIRGGRVGGGDEDVELVGCEGRGEELRCEWATMG